MFQQMESEPQELGVKTWNNSNWQEDGRAMNWFWYLEV